MPASNGRPTFEERLAAAIRDDQGCLIWQGGVNKGYARFSGTGAHRVSYEAKFGPIPSGMTVDHLCFNTLCVEPSHLRLLTVLENARNHQTRPTIVPESECINGHRYTIENTYTKPDGRTRDCRACIRQRVRRYKLRRAGAAAA